MKKLIMTMIKKKGEIKYKIDPTFKACNDTNTYGQEWDFNDNDYGNRQIDSDTGWVIQDEDDSTGYYSI